MATNKNIYKRTKKVGNTLKDKICLCSCLPYGSAMKNCFALITMLSFSTTVWANTDISTEVVKYNITIEEPEYGAELVLDQNDYIPFAPRINLDCTYTIENKGKSNIRVHEVVEIYLAGPTATSLTKRIGTTNGVLEPKSVSPRHISAQINLDNFNGIHLTKPGKYELKATFKIMNKSEEVYSSASSAKIKFKVKRPDEEGSQE